MFEMRRFLFPLTLSLALAGCPKQKADEEEEEFVDPVKTFVEDGYKKVTLDLNGDEKADVVNFYREGEGPEKNRLVRKEIDLNFKDGADVIQVWDNGQMTQETINADFDANFDWTDFYDGGERIRAEWDTAHDGTPDLIRYYEQGQISRLERDTTNDGKMDYFEYYEGGVMQRSGWDLNADGKIDRWGEQ